MRVLSSSDPPSSACTLPAALGPATQLTCMSLVNGQLQIDSTESMRYFTGNDANPSPALKKNVRDGLKAFLRRPLKDKAFKGGRLDNVFAMCVGAQRSAEMLEADVVTWRGILTKIMMRADLSLAVSYFDGTLYLEEDSTQTRFDVNLEGNYTGSVILRKLTTKWFKATSRHKFETLSSRPSTGGTMADDVDMHTLWAVGIKRRLGTLDIVLVGEVDCVDAQYSPAEPSPSHYVELKTRKFESPQLRNLARWDIQSGLIDCPRIFVGFPDRAGVVRETRNLPVFPIPQDKLDWCARVLHALIDLCAAEHGDRTGGINVWQVRMKDGEVHANLMSDRQVARMNADGPRKNGILPMTFLAALAKSKGMA
ncbi:unnamed protein product [Mycena citricolor]|uniref:Decapping nuclease n=1 Tax=Mycena citricolor TaxID=2018698 RepID=A0AAD2HPV6_9AGAR|nr:unnamed protein product [Mycena citricolor]